jgi:hypothetical protein
VAPEALLSLVVSADCFTFLDFVAGEVELVEQLA